MSFLQKIKDDIEKQQVQREMIKNNKITYWHQFQYDSNQNNDAFRYNIPKKEDCKDEPRVMNNHGYKDLVSDVPVADYKKRGENLIPQNQRKTKYIYNMKGQKYVKHFYSEESNADIINSIS